MKSGAEAPDDAWLARHPNCKGFQAAIVGGQKNLPAGGQQRLPIHGHPVTLGGRTFDPVCSGGVQHIAGSRAARSHARRGIIECSAWAVPGRREGRPNRGYRGRSVRSWSSPRVKPVEASAASRAVSEPREADSVLLIAQCVVPGAAHQASLQVWSSAATKVTTSERVIQRPR